VSNELESIWKEQVMTYSKALSQHLSKKTEENHKNLSQDNQSSVSVLNKQLSEYEAGVPTN
jgi:hypothetical protein